MHKGFSLLELMVAVAVIAILVGLAMPGFQTHTQRAQRMEVRLKLLEVMDAQHRHRLLHKTYTKRLDDVAGSSENVVGQAVVLPQKHYTITATTCDDDIKLCVRLVATPSPTLNNLVLTLDSNGRRAPEKAWR